ncbi:MULTISPECIES: twin-arginine translocase TatA/TatE family subunit [Paenibacillus]|uniref:Sec-independent protein translocase protein TatA n=2 Tax=Paenibacillus TaxID=44249 RepID=A0A163YXS4_9BACL|nr:MULTISPECIES: twin-arginine translocase TatA/TatE family subunit [Paenibacillus]KPV59505.1 preprotein translocase subunit TatA [Paenibacillus sp. A3]KZE80567.1 preprotein translocase subunit TatA [Paenibacillus elgii]MBU7320566.1 twin-arginine translocase TatA/TatE family subunit [Paenibacillus oleatilyticus]MCM3270003.1 twin-arginine translocase TatA/TatE family subunit [Paenibacillus elgii]MCP1309444.1 twin-arginine translocase TatA/TatE family subunit [Paenibacillus tyrfis]
MGALSPWHIILIALVALLLFGPNKLPELGRGFGKMFREFKDATSGNGGRSDDNPPEPEAPKKELAAPAASSASEPVQPTANK